MLNDRKPTRLNSNKQKYLIQQTNDNQFKRKKINSASFGFENMKMNNKNGLNFKNNPKLLEQQVNRAQKEKKEMKIKIINAVIKRNLHKLELQGLVDRLDKMKIQTIESIEKNKDNQSKVYARKEKLILSQEESQQSIDALENDKKNIESMNMHKENQIKTEEADMTVLKQRENHINQVKYTIDSDIFRLTNKVTEALDSYSIIFEELQQMKKKKDKSNSIRLDILINILILKPLNKKICLLHNYLNENPKSKSDDNNAIALINKNRKTFSIKNTINKLSVMSYSFDYIISAIDQIYEEASMLSNEREYIWNEVFNIVNAYFKETDFLFILIMTHNNQNEINWDIIDLCKKLTRQSNYRISIKGLLNQSLFNITDDIANEENLEKTIRGCNLTQGLVYSIYRNNAKPKIIISSCGIESEETESMISIINDINNKKKKDKTKIKLSLSNHFLFNELSDINIPFHSLTILDTSVSAFNDNDVVDFVYKSTQ